MNIVNNQRSSCRRTSGERLPSHSWEDQLVQNRAPDDAPDPTPEDQGTVFLRRQTLAPRISRQIHRSTEIQIGETIKERFIVEGLLGEGGMGRVYLTVDLRKQEQSDRNPYIAIKVLKESLRDHPLSVRAMQREARKAQELAHPNIIKVYDFDRDGDRHFISMEYLVGKSLDRVIKAPGYRAKPLS